jgi:transcriptional regulator with XRE-family HTH domain
MKKSILSENLVKARKLKEWSQAEAALKIGIKRGTLGTYENNKAKPPIETFTAICEAYNVEDDVYGFINNRDFFDKSGRRIMLKSPSMLERKYHASKGPIRTAIDTLLDLPR